MRRAAVAFAAFSLISSAPAAEIYKLNKTTKGGKELSVASYFKIKDNCEFKELPEIELSNPPKSGTVCMRSDMVPETYGQAGTSTASER
jgi:hypothetical protein